ncbi:DUF6607 family protein [Mucilaginibacter xinganensis]|uniref:Uncharacterized protein n=1 Tax=Mucilaginibacter xinganensis TaxID=1234841 RepID=A0A223P0L0_9SPHI|nr:DUF6607 family protein [Mucilaginibacter xinganensis]ASU35689.1 hypothetical protein MuYL_3804 [Mucilaginibacter xinganensis]
MKKATYLIILLITFQQTLKAQTKFDEDRKAILSLGGFYKVTFDYAETFTADTGYKFYPRYHASGYEMAVIEQDSKNKIVIQHLLLTGDSAVIKHWREDWVYEEAQLLKFNKDNTWANVRLNDADVKGRWVQKVFQVDDGPRYESIGTWVHVDGKHQWQSDCDSPLPRREFTKRGDYNVLQRGNRIYLTPTGWMFEQDNKKVVRTDNSDRVLVREKGYEEFTHVDTAKFAFAQSWWKKQQPYWTAVRQVWDEIYSGQTVLKLQGKINGKPLYEKLFALADQSAKEKWDTEKNKKETRKVIADYLIRS